MHELNIDGLVGPTHHYAGLARGNLASSANAKTLANPQAAALQGLAKMRFLARLGLKQALFPPHQRPNLTLLHQLGFTGSPFHQIERAARLAPELLSAAYSAASMWTANAATVSASVDCWDNRVHFTAANLITNLHRQPEAPFTHQLLKRLFADEHYFIHHPPLPCSLITADEGAANHNRLTSAHAKTGINVFVYGHQALCPHSPKPLRYPARQTLEASQAVARNHQLRQAVFVCQNPIAIDEGVFHNDVISLANEGVFLIHEQAFVNQAALYETLYQQAEFDLQIICIPKQELSLKEAVSSYLFNSQLVSLPDKTMSLIAPIECREQVRAKQVIDKLLADKNNPINQVHYLDLRQSMRNGGGPACLRLRVPLSEAELTAMHQGVLLDDVLFDKVEQWIKRHYRTQLTAADLKDPLLLNEVFTALDELTTLLRLGSIYPFQVNETS